MMGLAGWSVDISTEYLTKGGEVRQAFSVDIKSPSYDAKTPWELWSGGEAQRLRLASALGLSVMIQRLKGVCFNIEIWDEPVTFLSEEGIQDLLELLKNRSLVLKSQIWLICHTIDSFGGFTGGTHIIKDEKGSRIFNNTLQIGE